MDKNIKKADINKVFRKEFTKSYNSNFKIAVYIRDAYDKLERQYQNYRIKYYNFDITEFYIDDAASKKYNSFKKMIQDAEADKFQVIIMRDYFMFENIDIMVDTIRKLRKLSRPVGIYFEKECRMSFDLPDFYVNSLKNDFERKLKERFIYDEISLPDSPLPPIIEQYKNAHSLDFGEVLSIRKIPQKTAIYLYIPNKNNERRYAEYLERCKSLINLKNEWEYVGTYVDVGSYDVFNEMMEKCKNEEIDCIITKSVCCFRKNISDTINVIKLLSDLSSPVGIYFETENIYTLNSNGIAYFDFFQKVIAQETKNKSKSMADSISHFDTKTDKGGDTDGNNK